MEPIGILEKKYPGVTRWQLRDDVGFAGAYELDEKSYLEGIHYLIDKINETGESERNVIPLTETQAFIVSFIAMGVDTEKHLPDIVLAEYEISGDIKEAEAKVKKEINIVMEMLGNLDYLRPREKTRMPELPGGLEVTRRIYELKEDFIQFPIIFKRKLFEGFSD